jgi:hypothetical protein
MLVPVKNKPAVPVQLLHQAIDEYGWTSGGIAFYLDSNDPDSLVEYNFEAKVYKVGSKCGIITVRYQSYILLMWLQITRLSAMKEDGAIMLVNLQILV